MISQLSHTLIFLTAIIIFAVAPADSEPVSELILHHPGGTATPEIIEPDTAFSRPVATLPSSALPHFTAGATLFYTRWVARPAKQPALKALVLCSTHFPASNAIAMMAEGVRRKIISLKLK